MSETQDSTENVLKLVEKAQSKGVFDITEFAKGRAYPSDSVTAYLDVDAAYELTKINSQINSVLLGEEGKVAELEAKAQELSERLLASKIVFHMRGVNQSMIEGISKKCDELYPPTVNIIGQEETNPEWIREWTCGLVAANLVSVENAQGEFDERVFTADEVNDFRQYLPKEIWDMVTEKMQQLTLAGAYFRGLTDAGFLPKS